MPHFHCTSSPLGIGSIIEPGNWGRIIANFGWKHACANREVTLEYVRQTEFTDKPSRLRSVFLLDDETEARFYAASDGRGTTMIPYEVEVLNQSAPIHNADWRHVNPEGPLDMEWARNYWRGIQFTRHTNVEWDVACREVICESAIRIIRRL
jgi:hypothetical protein